MSASNDNKNSDGTTIDLERGKNAEVSSTVYMHSEEMMALVRELYDHWRDDPRGDNTGNTMYYYSGLLVSNAPAYVEIHNISFNTNYVFDSQREKELCLAMLNDCRCARGVHIFGNA